MLVMLGKVLCYSTWDNWKQPACNKITAVGATSSGVTAARNNHKYFFYFFIFFIIILIIVNCIIWDTLKFLNYWEITLCNKITKVGATAARNNLKF